MIDYNGFPSNSKFRPPQAKTQAKLGARKRESFNTNNTLSENARKRAKTKAKETAIEEIDAIKVEVDGKREDMSQCLKEERIKYNEYDSAHGSLMVGAIANPRKTTAKISDLSNKEVVRIMAEVAEIKIFLLLRLLLSQTTIPRATLGAESIALTPLPPSTCIRGRLSRILTD